ncbi:MAG TPA: glycosyltransferase family 39 protein [Blastocatellia bacterium]|nr:glycosyltransferase family 39 protein [Blastocatellia bacterium]
MDTSSHRPRLVLLAVLALAIAPYFIGLGASSLWDSNEAFYAESPREMIESGDYINPSFNYQPRFNKPPLSYWVVAGFYKLFGVSEWAERLSIALGALILIALTFALGRAVFSVEAGLLAAIALAANPRVLMFSRRIFIDVYLAMFMGLSLLLFVLAERQPRRRRLWLALMYASVGLGVMTKGPVAAVLAGAAFFVYLLATRSASRIREMMLPVGVLIIAIIVLPWYAAVYGQHGWSYIESFLVGDNLSRYTQPVWGPRRSVLFYLPVLAGDLFPWSVFLFAACLSALRGFIARRRLRANETPRADDRMSMEGSYDERGAILWAWVAVIVVFFSFSSNKEDLYILPVYPVASALVGGFVGRLVSESTGTRRWFLWPGGITGAALAVLGGGVLYVLKEAPSSYSLAGTTAIGMTVLAGGLVAMVAVVANRRLAAVLVIAMSVAALNWILVGRTLPDFERYKPVREYCEIIRERAGPDAMVGYYRFASPSMVFYLRRPVFEYYREEDLLAAMASGREVYCLMTARDYAELAQRLPRAARVLATRPVFQVKLGSILDRAELPQVVLISNGSGAAASQ